MTIAPARMLRQDPVPLELDSSLAGNWRVEALGRGWRWVDITSFRGIPTEIGEWSFSDPFGPRDFSFSVPNVSVFDDLGSGDLAWCTPEMRVRLTWVDAGTLAPAYGYGAGKYGTRTSTDGVNTRRQLKQTGWTPGFSWSGNLASRGRSSSGLSLTFKGGLLQLDDFLAKPEYPARPMTYEQAILRQFRDKPHLRLGAAKMVWPDWYRTVFHKPGKRVPHYLIPTGVHAGQLWTGLVTRETGHWDPVLTSYINGLLSSMYTARGRWTLDLYADGPVLAHRDMLSAPDGNTVVIDPLAPGFEISADEDFSQSLGVVYASGQALDGVAWSGMEVSNDGSSTWYEPAAARRELDPIADNDWLNPSKMRREVLLQAQHGLDAAQGIQVAREHLRRFGDPGMTGTITIKSDPMVNGVPFNRMLVRAGMSLQIPGLFGRPQGLFAHITENRASLAEGSNTLTYDTRFRDALTVREVRMRGRDALQIPRMLVAGQYQPPVPDQLVPWNYAKGSGYLPSGHEYNCRELFDGMPQDMSFPWEPMTIARPPRHPRWRHCYMRVGPASTNPDNNWGHIGHGQLSARLAFPIKAAQSAQIRLLELAAYDSDGNVLPVAFHFALYLVNGTSVLSMPRILAADDHAYGPGSTTGVYRKGKHYPFGINYFDQYQADGTLQDPNIPQPMVQGGLINGAVWGTHFEKAGYYPGSDSGGGAPTGLLRTETPFSIDTTQLKQSFDPVAKAGKQPKNAGMVYAMIYCDEQADQEVFFMGRMYRVEPGQN